MLTLFANWLTFSIFNLSAESLLGKSVQFFIYDSIKIMLLLFVMISIIGYLRSFLPPEKIQNWIKNKKFSGHIMASIFGSITPFCSCSSIPMFFSFLKAGVPLGIVFSFLITSPLVNEYLVVLMFGFFGWKITVFYVLFGNLLGIFAGFILGKMNLEKYIDDDFKPQKSCCCSSSKNSCGNKTPIQIYENQKDRLKEGMNEAIEIIKKLWLWILLGVGVGAFIHNYVPQEFFMAFVNKTGVFSVIIATLIGVPMYGSCAAIVPIAVVLFQKGLPLGTVLAFMMAISALSLPEAIILKQAMKLKLLVIFFSITSVGIILVGYFFNLIAK